MRPTPAEEMGIGLGNLPEVRLPAVDRDALLREDALGERGARVKALRFGVGRSLQLSVQDGNWYDVAGGRRLWVAEIASTDALGLRLHFKNVQLPAGAELAVYPAGRERRRQERLLAVRPRAERGVPRRLGATAAGEFWTGSFFGERVRIEYLAPAGAAADALPFTVDNLQHYYLDPVDKVARSLVGEKAAGPCHNDVTCHPEWANVAKAVSGISFVEDGGSFFCSGQLINDNAQDFTPYYLTANHCISSQSGAGSAEFFWFYQTATCNGNPPSIDSVPRSNGATLVSPNATSDYSLMIVEGALPDNLFWAGWTGKAVPDGTDAVAIHHPAGDYKRISFGFKDDSRRLLPVPGHQRAAGAADLLDRRSHRGGLLGLGDLPGRHPAALRPALLRPVVLRRTETVRLLRLVLHHLPKIKKILTAGSDDKLGAERLLLQGEDLVKAGTLSNRIVKVNDTDWYKISVPAHKTVTITLNFNNANGDIDLAAFASCAGGDPVASSTGGGNSETISLTNNGSKSAFAYWQVYLASDTRNNYDMSVSVHTRAGSITPGSGFRSGPGVSKPSPLARDLRPPARSRAGARPVDPGAGGVDRVLARPRWCWWTSGNPPASTACARCPTSRPGTSATPARGLVIVGVHTPEFELSADPALVAAAVRDEGIPYPVLLDADAPPGSASPTTTGRPTI